MSTITTTNLTKEFEDVTAVDGIDLNIDDGTFVVIVGPSGCGKSTTLRLLAGLESPTRGEIRIGGDRVNDIEAKDRGVAMVFQNYALYPHMTASENITFGTKTAVDVSSDEISQRVDTAAATLDIEDLLDRKPAELSGGEQQRVAIARALVRDPDVLLMDEPLSNLDAKLRIQMRAELAALHDELQTTTVYVTHNQTEAMTLGDEVIVLNNGTVQQVDPPQRLYDRPETRFVAEFIGSPAMNVVPVSVESNRAVHESFFIDLPGGAEAAPNGDAVLGVRPEDLDIVESGEMATKTIDITISLVESLGDNLLLYGRSGDAELQVVSYHPQRDLSKGDVITVTYDPERLHLFDPDTGAAIYHSGAARTGGTATRRTVSPE